MALTLICCGFVVQRDAYTAKRATNLQLIVHTSAQKSKTLHSILKRHINMSHSRLWDLLSKKSTTNRNSGIWA